MESNISRFPHPPFTRTIELYGDRTANKGNFGFAGLAWTQAEKVVLIQGDVDSFSTPSTWYRFLRLIELAKRLKKPIILWNLPAVHVATTPLPTSLALARVIQNVQIKLLKSSQPLITLFDETYPWGEVITVSPEGLPTWGDATLIVRAPDALPNLQPQLLRIAEHPADIPALLVELLRSVSTIPKTELVAKRRETLCMLAKIHREHA